jgi:hypothetical protein
MTDRAAGTSCRIATSSPFCSSTRQRSAWWTSPTHPAQARSDYGGLWGADDLSFLSRYDGLSAFRLTPLGAYLLGREAAYQPPAVASSVALSFSPGLYVEVVRGVLAAEETLLLDNWAIPVQAGTWRLDREKSLSAIEKGHDIAELKGFLESTGGLPLPEPVESFIGFASTMARR